MEKIRGSLDKKQFACCIFINLQRAFGTVKYDILLARLKYYGVKGTSNMWFQTFLKERYQYANVKE